MACWSRVFSGGITTTLGGCTMPGSFNITEPNQFTVQPSLLDEIPVQVNSIAEAVGYWVEQLRRRLAAKATIMGQSSTVYAIELRRGTRLDTMTWQVSNAQAAYPLVISYTTADDSASAVQFQNINHALDWLVDRLA